MNRLVPDHSLTIRPSSCRIKRFHEATSRLLWLLRHRMEARSPRVRERAPTSPSNSGSAGRSSVSPRSSTWIRTPSLLTFAVYLQRAFPAAIRSGASMLVRFQGGPFDYLETEVPKEACEVTQEGIPGIWIEGAEVPPGKRWHFYRSQNLAVNIWVEECVEFTLIQSATSKKHQGTARSLMHTQ